MEKPNDRTSGFLFEFFCTLYSSRGPALQYSNTPSFVYRQSYLSPTMLPVRHRTQTGPEDVDFYFELERYAFPEAHAICTIIIVIFKGDVFDIPVSLLPRTLQGGIACNDMEHPSAIGN